MKKIFIAISIIFIFLFTTDIQSLAQEVYVCKNPRGIARFVDSPNCGPSETLIILNAIGPAGPQGQAGPQGPEGPQGPQGDPGLIDFSMLYEVSCGGNKECECQEAGDYLLSANFRCPLGTAIKDLAFTQSSGSDPAYAFAECLRTTSSDTYAPYYYQILCLSP